MNAETAPKGALDGLTVIGLTMMLAGPYAAMMLADQGARIIKIEPPAGDNARRIGPHLEGGLMCEDGGYGAYFASIGHNKESIIVDLKQEAGKQVLRRLVAKADVIMENFRSGVMERLGLSYEALSDINPRLVYAALRGFGDARGGESPYASWPAYDPVSQAMGGIMGITSTAKGGAPTKIGPGVGDIMPAMFLAFGIASACWRAQRTGEGQFVGIAMGTGADVAMESAGVTLVKGDLGGIVRARHLSAATMANIRQNLFFAFIYNVAGVPVAAGVLYPALGILLSPIIAAAAMALSSVSVIGNALRLNRVRL